MAARLYPGFGSGRGTFEAGLEVRSVESAGFPHLEVGDKVILPTTAFKEISRLKLPFPMVFRVENERRRSSGQVASRTGATKRKRQQFCGVQEFSAAKGKAFMPKWMMKNLRIREGGRAFFTSVRGMPKGEFVRFQPHTTEFIDLAAALGPRELMEHAMKTYSALSVGETIVVECSGSRFKLNVVEVKPGPKDDPANKVGGICLYGDLDLEADFAPALDTIKAPETPVTPMEGAELEDLAAQALAAAQGGAAAPAEPAPAEAGGAAFAGSGHTLGGGRPSSAKRLRSTVAASRQGRAMSPIQASPAPSPGGRSVGRGRRAAPVVAGSSKSRVRGGGRGGRKGAPKQASKPTPAPASPGFRRSTASAPPPAPASFGLGFYSGTWRGLDLGTPPRGMTRAQRAAADALGSAAPPSSLFASPGPGARSGPAGSTLPASMAVASGGEGFTAAGVGHALRSPARTVKPSISPVAASGTPSRTAAAGRAALSSPYGTPTRSVGSAGGVAESKRGGRVSPIQSPARQRTGAAAAAAGRRMRQAAHK